MSVSGEGFGVPMAKEPTGAFPLGYGFSYRQLHPTGPSRKPSRKKKIFGRGFWIAFGITTAIAVFLFAVSYWRLPDIEPSETVSLAGPEMAAEGEVAAEEAAPPPVEPVDSEDRPYGPELPPELQRKWISLHVEAGDTLTGLLEEAGIAGDQSRWLLSALGNAANLNLVPLGAVIEVVVDGLGQPREARYEPRALVQYRGVLEPDGWRFLREEVPLEAREEVVLGTVKESLFAAVQEVSERPELAVSIASLFAWQIDFAKQTRPGDRFRVVVEKRYRDGSFWDYGALLAAQYENAGRSYEAFCVPAGSGDQERRECFDGEGNSLQRSFLRAPLKFARVSSKYTKRRFHPVLKIFRPHEGVDYAAPVGTPVWSVADGRAEFVGRRGGNGNMVIVSHPGGYQTYYNHLSRFAKGVRRGSLIRQKQVIGYVGSTGLSTGPHLDYRIKKGGKFLDPLKIQLPPGKPIAPGERDSFARFRDRMRERIEAASGLAQAGTAGHEG